MFLILSTTPTTTVVLLEHGGRAQLNGVYVAKQTIYGDTRWGRLGSTLTWDDAALFAGEPQYSFNDDAFFRDRYPTGQLVVFRQQEQTTNDK